METHSLKWETCKKPTGGWLSDQPEKKHSLKNKVVWEVDPSSWSTETVKEIIELRPILLQDEEGTIICGVVDLILVAKEQMPL